MFESGTVLRNFFQSDKGYAEIFLKIYMGGWLVGFFSKTKFFLWEKYFNCICTTDRFVVLIFSQLFFLAGKNKASKYKIASK